MQSKSKNKDASTNSAAAAQAPSDAQQPKIVEAKPAAEFLGQQMPNGGAEQKAVDDSSITVRPMISTAPVTPAVPGLPAASALAGLVETGSEADAYALGMSSDSAEKTVTAQKAEPSTGEKQDGPMSTAQEAAAPVSASSQAQMAIPQDILRELSNKALPALDAAPASGTDAKSTDPKKAQSVSAKPPVDAFPDLQPTAVPVQATEQTNNPASLPPSGFDASSLVLNKAQEPVEGTSGSGRKAAPASDSHGRRKSDDDATQTTATTKDNAPEVVTSRNVPDLTPRFDLVSQQIQGGQSAATPPAETQSGNGGSAADGNAATAPTSQAGSDVHLPEAAPLQALSGAHLVQSIHQSEMKLGLNSAEFGSISINTSVTHQVLSAQISLDHPELSRILSAHLPAVEEKLGQAYGLQTKVEVRDGSTGQSGAGEQGRGSESARSRSGSQFGQSGVSRAMSSAPGTSVIGDVSRLDVRV